MALTIQRVDIFPLEYQEPNDDNNTRYITLARIETNDGVIGWGEAITQFREATYATTAMLDHGLSDILIGQNPLDTERLWNLLRGHVWWYGGSGIAAFAISALDMALWDIKGKVLGLPLYQLLGGKQIEKLPVCASTHPKASEIDVMAAELARHIENGYRLVKVGFGKKGRANLGIDAKRDIEFVRAVRAAIGEDAGFIVDIGAKLHWSVPYAVAMARAFAEYHITWLEDPFQPDNFAGYQQLRQAVPELLVGFGERFWNIEDYHRLLKANVCDVILVDPGRTEGITGMHQITQLAAGYNVGMDPHCWSSAIITAASLHIATAAPNATIFEMKPMDNPMQHELVTEPFRHVDGYITAPDRPGLGIEVIESVVEKYNLKRK